MAAPRLSDEQKAALVEGYRAGTTAAELASEYGCSAATVTRVVKAALSSEDYERLKQARARGGARSSGAPPISSPQLPVDPVAADPVLPQSVLPDSAEGEPISATPVSAAAPSRESAADPDPAEQAGGEQSGVLAIDDADDFGDDSDAEAELEADAELFVALPVMPLPMDGEQLQCKPLEQAELPASAYMLVDKTVELEAKPLREFPELGTLPPEEEERRALMLFANPRKAKQLCGRSQRVIKLPDPWVLHRTARYLVAQGITRVVVEGSLYSLPGS